MAKAPTAVIIVKPNEYCSWNEYLGTEQTNHTVRLCCTDRADKTQSSHCIRLYCFLVREWGAACIDYLVLLLLTQ